jgi:hypothetical protein
MSEGVIVAIVGGLALIGGALVTALGTAFSSRKPRDLRHAALLGERLEKMAPDSGERQLAADYHDDLVASWVLGRVKPSYTVWRDVASSLLSVGAIFSIGGAVAFVVLLFIQGVMGSSSWTSSIGFALASIVAGVLAITLAVLVAVVASKRLQQEVDAVRAANGLRESVGRRQSAALKEHRAGKRSDRSNPRGLVSREKLPEAAAGTAPPSSGGTVPGPS